jgi:hypothetical protein
MAITLGIDKPSFVVDSRDRGDGSIENFSYVISITENDTSGEFNQVAITSCTIPKSYYDLAVDSELRVDEDGDTRTITIPKGNYNVNSIQNVLLKLLNEPATLENDKPIYQMRYPDCRLDNDVGKFTWTVSYTNFTEWIDATAYVVGNRIIVDGVDDVLVFNVTYLCILNHTSTPLDKPEVGVNWETYWRVSEITWEIIGDNRLHDILGFDKDVSGTTIILFENNQLTSKNVINLEHTKYISIRSNICHNEGARDGDPDILARIPIDDTDKTVIHYRLIQLEDEIKTLVTSKSNTYRFSLYDDDNRLLDLNGNNWSMTLFVSRFNYHDEIDIKHIKVQNIEKLNIN